MTRFIGATPEQMQGPMHACDRPALLHVAHSWGGGIERWVHDYATADIDSWNLLLRSRTWRNAAGVRLELVDLAAEGEVLLAWEMEEPIPCTAIAHGQYEQIVQEIVAVFGVEAVLVSSLIGHSLDVLGTGLPTVVVLHDFFPFCPALFAWFGKPCASCDEGALQRCLATNPYNAFWYLDDTGQWLALRDAFADRLAEGSVGVAAPGRAVRDRYAKLFPVLRDKPWHEIPHGLLGLSKTSRVSTPQPAAQGLEQQRLRVVVPGRLLPHKGLHLLSAMVGELTQFAEVLLLGCGDYGLPFRGIEHVEVIPNYVNAALGNHVHDFAPDCALLVSVLPESFSYTLSEMFALGVPVVATRLGAFAARIEDGGNGFLVEPDSGAVLRCLRELAEDRVSLERVASNLQTQPVRSAGEMVGDYRELLRRDAQASVPSGTGPRQLASAIVRHAAARRFLRAEVASRQQRVNQLSGEAQHLVQARAKATEHAAMLQKRADALETRVAALDGQLAAQHRQAEQLKLQLATVQAQRDMILLSTSWRMTGPLRTLAGMLGRGGQSVLAADVKAARVRLSEQEAAGSDTSDNRGMREKRAAAPVLEKPPPASVQSLLVECAPGDQLSLARIRWLEKARGMHAGRGFDSCTAAVPEGFPIVVHGTRPTGAAWVAACFEGLDVSPSVASGALAIGLDRVLVPTDRIARQFRSLWPELRADVQLITYPLTTEWPVIVDYDSQRTLQRERLGLPDKTRLVLGIGDANSRSGLARFAALAMQTCAQRNDIRFVWLGARNHDWERNHWMEVGLPVAMRQLFFVQDPDFAVWLLAADAYLGCRAAEVYDAGAVEALAAGLPVCVASLVSLPEAVRETCADRVSEARDEAVVDWLATLFVPLQAARRPVVKRPGDLLERFGSPAVREAFSAACTDLDWPSTETSH